MVWDLSTHLTQLLWFEVVSNSTWWSHRLSGLQGADSCLTRGEDQPPHTGETWHVPSNTLLCWLSRITILRLSRQKFSQPLRHPNSLVGRNPVVLSTPISLLCVHCEGSWDSGLSCQQSQDSQTLMVSLIVSLFYIPLCAFSANL